MQQFVPGFYRKVIKSDTGLSMGKANLMVPTHTHSHPLIDTYLKSSGRPDWHFEECLTSRLVDHPGGKKIVRAAMVAE